MAIRQVNTEVWATVKKPAAMKESATGKRTAWKMSDHRLKNAASESFDLKWKGDHQYAALHTQYGASSLWEKAPSLIYEQTEER
jgi:hypothetical protein